MKQNVFCFQAGQQDTQFSIEVSVLELFVHYIQLAPGHYLAETWQSLLGLLKEGITLSPPSQFMLLSVLSQFVHRAPAPLADRKDQKDLQDITAKVKIFFFQFYLNMLILNILYFYRWLKAVLK